jgi:hypothetical protein
VFVRGAAAWSSSYYVPGPPEVLENPWMQYCVLLPREQLQPHAEAFRPTNVAALRALGLETGFSHMELVVCARTARRSSARSARGRPACTSCR